MKRFKRKWLVFMALTTILCIAGAFLPDTPDLWKPDAAIVPADVAWMITATIFVLMMTPGLSFFYGGMVGKKNVISTILQSFIAMGLISVIWVVIGFSLAFGDDIGGVLGNPTTYFMFSGVGAKTHPLLAPTIPLALYALFQMKFAIITPSLITGSFAERVKFSAYLVFMTLFCIVIYCPLAHCTWHPDGLFRQWGVVDFAGGIVVHASSGIAALAGAIFLGRRVRPEKNDAPANIPYVVLGAAMLWLGWFGFNAGSSLHADATAVKAFLNTNTACATAMLTWIFFDTVMGRKASAMGAAVGAVVGLVAITPSAGYVSVGQSFFIAFIVTLICNCACHWSDRSHRLDDALDVFPTHGTGGLIGTVLTGIFIQEGLISGTREGVVVFLYHLLAIVIVVVYTFVMSMALYWIVNRMIPMRVSRESERVGLDVSQHGESYNFADTQDSQDVDDRGEMSY